MIQQILANPDAFMAELEQISPEEAMAFASVLEQAVPAVVMKLQGAEPPAEAIPGGGPPVPGAPPTPSPAAPGPGSMDQARDAALDRNFA